MSTAAETNPAYSPPKQSQQVYPPLQQQAAVYLPAGYAQPGYVAPQQVTLVHVPTTQTKTKTSLISSSKRYKKKAALATGILQIVVGSFSATVGIVLFFHWNYYYQLYLNIWGGLAIIAYMLMCIISALCAGSQVIYDSVAASNSNRFIYDLCYYYTEYHYNDGYNDYQRCPRLKAIVALHVISALTALAEVTIAVVASAFCCHGLYGVSNSSQTLVATYNKVAPAGMTVTLVPVYYPQASARSYPEDQPHTAQGQPPDYTQSTSQEQPPKEKEQMPLKDA